MFRIVVTIVSMTGQPQGNYIPVREYDTLAQCQDSVRAVMVDLNKTIASSGILAVNGICAKFGGKA